MGDQTSPFIPYIRKLEEIRDSFYPENYNTTDYPPDAPSRPEFNKRIRELEALNKEFSKLVKYKIKNKQTNNNYKKIVYISPDGIKLANSLLTENLKVTPIRNDGRGLFSKKEMIKILSKAKVEYNMTHIADNGKKYIIPELGTNSGLFSRIILNSSNIVKVNNKEYKGLIWLEFLFLGTKLLDYRLIVPPSRITEDVRRMQEDRLTYLNNTI